MNGAAVAIQTGMKRPLAEAALRRVILCSTQLDRVFNVMGQRAELDRHPGEEDSLLLVGRELHDKFAILGFDVQQPRAEIEIKEAAN